jgi:hypothetical protein
MRAIASESNIAARAHTSLYIHSSGPSTTTPE